MSEKFVRCPQLRFNPEIGKYQAVIEPAEWEEAGFTFDFSRPHDEAVIITLESFFKNHSCSVYDGVASFDIELRNDKPPLLSIGIMPDRNPDIIESGAWKNRFVPEGMCVFVTGFVTEGPELEIKTDEAWVA